MFVGESDEEKEQKVVVKYDFQRREELESVPRIVPEDSKAGSWSCEKIRLGKGDHFVYLFKLIPTELNLSKIKAVDINWKTSELGCVVLSGSFVTDALTSHSPSRLDVSKASFQRHGGWIGSGDYEVTFGNGNEARPFRTWVRGRALELESRPESSVMFDWTIIQWYLTGKSEMGPHSNKENWHEHPIAGVSFGDARQLWVSEVDGDGTKDFLLPNRLVLMRRLISD